VTATGYLRNVAAAQIPPPEIRGLPIAFGMAKNVFCDWWFIDAGYGLVSDAGRQKQSHEGSMFMPRGVQLCTGRPIISDTPVSVADRPTDGIMTGAYSTLMQDGGKFRLWYESYLPNGTADEEVQICYAESDDGHTWKKPSLGLFEYGGSRDNNLVYSRGHGASIFIDSSAKSSERYKMIHLDKVSPQVVNGSQIHAFVFGAVSPDGIHWTRLPKPIIKHSSDTQSVAEYDPVTRKYVAYLRGWDSGRRIVVRTESAEFGNFPPPIPVLSLGPEDPPDADIYTNAYQRWPGAADSYLMTPAIYHRSSDHLDLQLAVSRDGMRWHFPQREPFLAEGQTGSGFEGAIYAGRGTVSLGNGTWAFPVVRYHETHNMIFKPIPEESHSGGIWLAKLREDGYVFLEAKDEGECWTQSATFTGSQLLINSWGFTGAKVAIEISDESGVPVPGFRLTDCDCLYGEQLWSPMTWRGKTDIGSLRGKVIRLRFSLNRVRLHAFRFA
jgi:hypothetical protein